MTLSLPSCESAPESLRPHQALSPCQYPGCPVWRGVCGGGCWTHGGGEKTRSPNCEEESSGRGAWRGSAVATVAGPPEAVAPWAAPLPGATRSVGGRGLFLPSAVDRVRREGKIPRKSTTKP